jgi:hypothetical protein
MLHFYYFSYLEAAQLGKRLSRSTRTESRNMWSLGPEPDIVIALESPSLSLPDPRYIKASLGQPKKDMAVALWRLTSSCRRSVPQHR